MMQGQGTELAELFPAVPRGSVQGWGGDLRGWQATASGSGTSSESGELRPDLLRGMPPQMARGWESQQLGTRV